MPKTVVDAVALRTRGCLHVRCQRPPLASECLPNGLLGCAPHGLAAHILCHLQQRRYRRPRDDGSGSVAPGEDAGEVGMQIAAAVYRHAERIRNRD